MADATFQGSTPSYPPTSLVVTMGAGAVVASETQRVTLASDDPAVASVAALGAKTDAKNSATDTTSVSIVSLLKQLSAYLVGVATAAKQPALGTAGTAASDVITVQGISSMTKLLVTPDSVALPSNQSVNVSQINGVTALMGNGVTGTGSQRVTIASDNTAFSVNAAQSGTWNVTNVSGTVSLPTGAATAAKQPALGTAGAASTDVITIQGIASGTVVPISVASIPSHAVTNAGTFAVQATEADGANTTLGSKADAKSTATDTTSITVMQVLKQISASVQAPPSQAVTNAGTFAAQAAITAASGSIASGAIASGAVASGAIASGAVASGAFASGSIAAGAVAAGATSFVKLEDAASADADAGVPAMMRRTAAPANTSGTDLDYEMLQGSGGYLWVHDNKGLANKLISAAFSTLTRPANTTAYSAADSISDNATAGSVSALSATVADVNDDPIFISEILISSTDTGLAGKKIRAYLFNADPTASSGVSGGDNAAYSQKKAGYVGSFMGWLETGFSDGTVGRLVPCFNETNFTQAGGFIVTKPTSGAATLYIQYQAVESFTPSGSSTTIIGTARGWQGRAA